MTNLRNIALITIVVLIIGYYTYVAILKKSIKTKLGNPSAAASADLDKLNLAELRHFNSVLDSYLEIRDKEGVEAMMATLTKMKNQLEDKKMKSIMSKTDNLKNFTMFSSDFISKINVK